MPPGEPAGRLPLLAGGLGLLPVAASAQPATERTLSPDELSTLLGAAPENLRIIIERETPAAAVGNEDRPALAAAIETAEVHAAEILHGAMAELSALPARIADLWPDGWAGLLEATALAIAACAAAWMAAMLAAGRFGPRVPRASASPEAERYSALLRHVGAALAGAALQIALAVIIFVALTERGSPDRAVGYAVILVGFLYLRLGFVLLDLVFGEAAAGGAGDTGARSSALRRRATLLVIALAVAAGVLSVIDRLRLGAGLFEAARLVVAAGFVAALSAVLWRHRRELTALAFRDPASVAACHWPWVALCYLAGALGLFVAMVLSEAPVNGLAILAPIYCGAIAAIVHAVCMALLLARRDAAPAGASGALSSVAPAADPSAPPGVAGTEDAHAIATAVAAAVWAGGLALSWGVPIWSGGEDGVHGFWAMLLILLLARIAWIAIRAWFDRRIAEERPAAAVGEPGDEGGGKGSRLGTLLPLFRSFLLITIGVIATMVVLAQLGVAIAPLFAGAGLVGVAIGFGAQSLVKDIFSGLFFLIDDAFRVGEYIETGGLRGTVEHISIRSMQLRHQNGPLHTIPFGEITQLTNYSRDWVIMKLPIRVTFNTDPERVRKLIKKLGQELMADPVIGSKFIDPLKSQGVREIDDSGQVIRVKFMTRPGEQFVLRKTVYARIRELFEREGIEFASREVRVRVTTQGEPLTEAEAKEVAAAAAEPLLDPRPA